MEKAFQQRKLNYWKLVESCKFSNKTDFEFLSSRQAIEDIANFILTVNREYKFNNPRWILIGCSYPGKFKNIS